MASEKISDLEKKYQRLKGKYFESLESSKYQKGDIRAFVGVKTWEYEREQLRKGQDKYTSHINSYESALSDLSDCLKSKTLPKELKISSKRWGSDRGGLQRQGGGRVLLSPPIPSMKGWKGNGMTQISLFSGAQGLDLGFMAAGFDLRFANDICPNSQKTITSNIPSVSFMLKDFAKVPSEEVLKKSGLKVGEVDVLTGGPPCQPFSTAGKRQGLSDPRASPLREFIRAIKEIKPRAFVMEEVTGLLSARLEHVPISEREGRTLKSKEQKGSVFKVVLEMIESTGYKFTYGVLNAADFGSPQVRNRVVFIGLREGEPALPNPTHAGADTKKVSGETLLPWNCFWEATADLQGREDLEVLKFSEKLKSYMKCVPPGGYWRHLPETLVKEAMGGAYLSGGGKMGYYRRLAWDEPSPTVVTSPTQKATLFCHPEETSPLSVEEYKRIQGFPDDWEIHGKAEDKYKLIGDAVPVHLSYVIAKKVAALLDCNQ